MCGTFNLVQKAEVSDESMDKNAFLSNSGHTSGL